MGKKEEDKTETRGMEDWKERFFFFPFLVLLQTRGIVENVYKRTNVLRTAYCTRYLGTDDRPNNFGLKKSANPTIHEGVNRNRPAERLSGTDSGR